eukprot:2988865-Rhodomonas_salina.2
MRGSSKHAVRGAGSRCRYEVQVIDVHSPGEGREAVHGPADAHSPGEGRDAVRNDKGLPARAARRLKSRPHLQKRDRKGRAGKGGREAGRESREGRERGRGGRLQT